MKIVSSFLLLSTIGFIAAASAAAPEAERFNPRAVSPRIIKTDAEVKIPITVIGKPFCEVVVPANRNTAFAGKELAAYLERIIGGGKVPVVRKPSGKVPAFILGEPAAKLAGVDLTKIDRDGFFIKTVGNNILIAGTDNPRGKMEVSAGEGERGTLYGVYEFLERFGGVRFYFPGEIGTIVPRKPDWVLPGIDICDRPDSQYRQTYCVGLKSLGNGKLNFYDDRIAPHVQRLSKFQLRESTLHMPNCHGLAYLGLVQRFAKSHPEFFALKDNGKRHDGSVVTRGSDEDGQLCFSSEGLKEVIFQDAKAFLTGVSAKERGILMPNGKYYWNRSRHSRPFFNIMPNDSNYSCKCPLCTKAKVYTSGPQVSSNHIWKFKTDIARRLQKEGVPGYCTMMAYSNYREIPAVDIPSNVIVQLAITGPWNELNPSQPGFIDLLKRWNEKLKAKTYLWTYTTKCGNQIADIPGFTPRAVGSFFKKTTPYSFGAFLESETDFWLFNFMNYYVFGKVMWDADTDVDALMAEHLRLMYGKAAPRMKEFYDTLERHWLKDIMSNIRETPIGPQAVIPSQFDIWSKIYGPAEIARIERLFDAAEKDVSGDAASLKRVKFMRREMWGRILDGAKRFAKHADDTKMWTICVKPVSGKISIDGKLSEPEWKQAVPVWMLPRTKEAVEVHTRVRMLADKDFFYMGIECDEPHTDKLIRVKRKFDELDMWQDNLVELFFSGKPQDEFVYQIMLTSDGNVCDSRNVPGNLNRNWNSGLVFKPGIVPGRMWVAEVKIPRKSMPELEGDTFRVNFTRGRKLDPAIKVVEPYYTWSKFRKQTAENCGTAVIGERPASKSVIAGGDFDMPHVANKRFLQTGNRFWWVDKTMIVDRKIFRTCGQSVCIHPDGGDTLRQYIPREIFKSNTRYKLSFFMKMKGVAGDKDHPRAGVTIDVRFGNGGKNFVFYPFKQPLTGDMKWTRFEFEFTTPENVGKVAVPYIGFNLSRYAKGMVWLDHVEMTEVGK